MIIGPELMIFVNATVILVFIYKLFMMLRDGHISRDEYRNFVRTMAFIVLLYSIFFGIKEYLNYSGENILQTRLKYEITKGIEVYVPFSNLNRQSACKLYRNGIPLQMSSFSKPIEIRQFCALKYYCETGEMISYGSQLSTCLKEQSYVMSVFFSLFRTSSVILLIGLIIAEIFLDGFSLLF